MVADNFVVPSDYPFVAAGLAMADTYHKKATGPDNEDLGPPAPQVLYDFAVALSPLDIGDVPRKSIQANIIDRLRKMSSVEHSTQVVAVFQIKPCHDTDFHKVIMVTGDNKVREALTAALSALSGVKHYTAPAPASGQEDELQKWIEKLEQMSE